MSEVEDKDTYSEDGVKKIRTTISIKYATREQKDIWRKLYVESDDPTGYTFAEKYVEGGYRRWLKIAYTYEAKHEVKEWMDTQAIRLQSQGYLNIAKQRDSFQASKWLADRGWEEKTDKRTKEAKKKKEEVDDHIKRDMERLGLRIVEK